MAEPWSLRILRWFVLGEGLNLAYRAVNYGDYNDLMVVLWLFAVGFKWHSTRRHQRQLSGLEQTLAELNGYSSYRVYKAVQGERGATIMDLLLVCILVIVTGACVLSLVAWGIWQWQ